ncbi:GPI anchored protein [Aspergillus fumigatus Z5]|nr:GPI anchored protein [Aspergillus fumigatus Z5]
MKFTIWSSLLALPNALAHPRSVQERSNFAHPGLLHTAADFSRITSKVNSKAEPWFTGWNKLSSSSYQSLSYNANPQAVVYRGSDGTHSENYASLYRDIAAAYITAIYWKVTGDTAYADKAVSILDAWAATLTGISGSSDKFLAAGIYGYEIANAAEIMRTYNGWSAQNIAKFQNMMVEVFYPLNHIFLEQHNGAAIDHYWANWDLCNIASMMSIGVLTDNRTMYDEAINYFKTGAGNGQIEKMIWKLYQVDGQTLGQGQEAGRDQGHAMLDFSLCWESLPRPLTTKATTCLDTWTIVFLPAEYVAKYNLGNDVPYTTYTNSDVAQTVISNASRGDIRPIWELLYNHYGVRKGLNVKYTKQYRDLVVEDGAVEGTISWDLGL